MKTHQNQEIILNDIVYNFVAILLSRVNYSVMKPSDVADCEDNIPNTMMLTCCWSCYQRNKFLKVPPMLSMFVTETKMKKESISTFV